MFGAEGKLFGAGKLKRILILFFIHNHTSGYMGEPKEMFGIDGDLFGPENLFKFSIWFRDLTQSEYLKRANMGDLGMMGMCLDIKTFSEY